MGVFKLLSLLLFPSFFCPPFTYHSNIQHIPYDLAPFPSLRFLPSGNSDIHLKTLFAPFIPAGTFACLIRRFFSFPFSVGQPATPSADSTFSIPPSYVFPFFSIGSSTVGVYFFRIFLLTGALFSLMDFSEGKVIMTLLLFIWCYSPEFTYRFRALK